MQRPIVENMCYCVFPNEVAAAVSVREWVSDESLVRSDGSILPARSVEQRTESVASGLHLLHHATHDLPCLALHWQQP